MKIMVGAHSLNFIPDRYRHRVGNLFSPGGFWNNSIDFALDNYVFASWKQGRKWDSEKFIAHLDRVKLSGKSPLWVVCPDAVGDCSETRQLWDEWSPRLRSEYGWSLAYAVQDGQTIEDVPTDADVIFVGGTTEWKRSTISMWCGNFLRCHVARINTYRWLWYCHKCGAESIDGTGWLWGHKRENQDLLDYLAITEGDRETETGALFPLYQYSRPVIPTIAKSIN